MSKLPETPDHAAVLYLLATLGLRGFPSRLIKVTLSLMSSLGLRPLGSACQGISTFSHSQRKRSHWGCADTRSFPCHQLLGEWAGARRQDAPRHASVSQPTGQRAQLKQNSLGSQDGHTCVVHNLLSSLLCCFAFSTDVIQHQYKGE